MKILNIEQGTEEWLKVRLGVATCSNFHKIITSTGKESATLTKYAFELAGGKIINEPDEGYKNEAMQRGNDLEPDAREFYEQNQLVSVKQIGMILTDCGNFGYSPDGLVGDNGLIEIKCPEVPNHTKYLHDNCLPTDYIPQVQGGLWISGREWCDFISYHPNFKEDKKIFIKRVYRDNEFIENLKQLCEKLIEKRDKILEKIK